MGERNEWVLIWRPITTSPGLTDCLLPFLAIKPPARYSSSSTYSLLVCLIFPRVRCRLMQLGPLSSDNNGSQRPSHVILPWQISTVQTYLCRYPVPPQHHWDWLVLGSRRPQARTLRPRVSAESQSCQLGAARLRSMALCCCRS